MLAFMRGVQGTSLLKQSWLCTFQMELCKQVASAGLTDLNEIAKQADLIQESLKDGQLVAFSSSQKTSTSYPPHQIGMLPHGSDSKRGKRQLVLPDLWVYHAKF